MARKTVDLPPVEQAYRESVSRVMARAIGEALKGFDLLQEAGFWVTRPQAFGLIKLLFRLRGVANLLALLPEDYASSPNLAIAGLS